MVVPQVADLSLIKTVNNATPNVGDVVTFTITVSNAGPNNATGVSVEDVVPNGYSSIGNISNGGSALGNVITWNGISIATGGSITRTFTAVVNAPLAGVNYKNIAEVTDADQYDEDSTPDNGADTDGDGLVGSEDPDGSQDADDEDDGDDAVVVPQVADLNLVKTVSDKYPKAGTQVVFTVKVTNEGPNNATGVQVTDDLPNGYSNPANISNGGVAGVGTITWNNLSIPAGGFVNLTFSVTVNQPAQGVDYVNIAEVTDSDQWDDDSTPNNGADNDNDDEIGSQDPDDTQDADDEDDGDDAYVIPTASLGDFVWEDLNGNGIQNIGEPGIANVEVNLTGTDIDGNTVDIITFTDANGEYLFDDLVPGNYTVIFPVIADIDGKVGILTKGDATGGSTDATDVNNDSDPDGSGVAETVVLSSGENEIRIDAGYYAPASLGDTVFVDLNGNGLQDIGESGIAEVQVTLNGIRGDGSIVVPYSTFTNANGYYIFDGLQPGTYYVTFPTTLTVNAAPALLTIEDVSGGNNDGNDTNEDSDANSAGQTESVTLISGEHDPRLDAGYIITSSIGDTVFVDADADGIQDPIETGLAGVTVTLLNGAGNPVLLDAIGGAIVPYVTGANGYYQFINLIPGDYRVSFSVPFGYDRTLQNVGNDADDSDADPTTGITSTYTLSPGEKNNTVDAGYYPTASLGDFVWLDADGDGVQDANEVGLANVTVNLYLDTNGDNNPDGGVIKSDVTDVDGYYLFENLLPNTYVVEFVKPLGYEFTTPNYNGGNTNTDAGDLQDDSDAIPATGLAHSVAISLGEAERDVDAGLYLPMSLGNLVWEDFNNDGLYTLGEQLFPGVELHLWTDLNNDGQPDINTGRVEVTDFFGRYLFDNLAPGNYVVQVIPSNFASGGILQGYTTSTGNGNMVDPDNDVDNDDNGYDPGLTIGIVSRSVTLINNTEPINDGNGNNSNLTVDFGFFLLSAIGDYVWEDDNANGEQDSDESGVNGVKVFLYQSNGTILDSMLTISNPNIPSKQGYYLFDRLQPGDYFVRFVIPEGYFETEANKIGVNDDKDSDVDNSMMGGSTGIITLSASERDLTVDLGIYREACLGNFVWIDYSDFMNGIQNNAIQDTNDLGINGVLITLFNANNNTIVNQMLTQNSPENNEPGWYLFDGLRPGNYYIKVAIPNGYVFVTPNSGSNDTIDSDVVDFINMTTLPLTLNPGQCIYDLDAGIISQGALPVELIAFFGKHNEKENRNDLTWVTASEVNNDYFEVLRSIDGVNFEMTGKVKGGGTSTKELTYRFADNDMIPNVDLYYYQLRQVDFDGRYELSDVIEIRVNSKVERNAIVYPNPVSEIVNVDVNGLKGDNVDIKLFDYTGKLVSKLYNGELSDVITQYRLDISNLVSGIYMMSIQVGDKNIQQRLIVID